jgi:PDZ domain-containing secreted protein
MKLDRRVPLPWLMGGAVVACVWCSFLSGLGGWIMGRDLAGREQQALYATETAARSNLPPAGVLVTRLDRAGPAARVGIDRGDMIVAIDGVAVEDARDLRDHLRSYRSGDIIRLTVLRERGQENLTLPLAAFPDDSRRPYLGIYYTARGDEPADL